MKTTKISSYLDQVNRKEGEKHTHVKDTHYLKYLFLQRTKQDESVTGKNAIRDKNSQKTEYLTG